MHELPWKLLEASCVQVITCPAQVEQRGPRGSSQCCQLMRDDLCQTQLTTHVNDQARECHSEDAVEQHMLLLASLPGNKERYKEQR